MGYELREDKPFIVVEYMLSMEESFNIWGWDTPDLYVWIGASICLVGISVMIFASRQ